MPVRQHPGEVTQLPQGFAETERNNPFGARVLGWLLPGASSSGRSVSNIGAVDVGAGPFGCHIKGNNARMQSDSFQTTGVEYPFTLVVVANRITRTGFTNVLAGLGNSGGNQLCGFQFQTVQNNRFVYRNVNAGTALEVYFSANATTASSGPVVLSATIASGSAATLYWNGVADTGTTIGSTSGTPALDRIALGGFDRSTDLFADTGNDVAGVFVLAGALSAAEHAAMAANPAQVFSDDVWEAVAASGTSTITGTGSTTLDNLTLSATGSITAQGQASVALAGVTLSAAGSITAQGAANITLADLSLAATGESTPVGSGTASITLDDVSVAATGSLVSRGQATVTLEDLSLLASGSVTNRGEADITLADLSLSATGGEAVSTLDLILKILSNRQELDPTSGLFTIYDDDGSTVLYTAAAWEDAAGTIPYRGQALRRIDRLSI